MAIIYKQFGSEELPINTPQWPTSPIFGMGKYMKKAEQLNRLMAHSAAPCVMITRLV